MFSEIDVENGYGKSKVITIENNKMFGYEVDDIFNDVKVIPMSFTKEELQAIINMME